MFSLTNCKDFCRAKPPIVTFLLCLVCLVIASFAFTIYVSHSDKITNSDAKQDWLALKQRLSEQNLCLGDESRKQEVQNDFVFETTFTTTISLNLTQFGNFSENTRFGVFYELDGWQPLCRDDYIKTSTVLNVNFVLTTNNASSGVCATVKGPKRFLPEGVTTCDGDINTGAGNKLATLFSQPKYCYSAANHSQIQLAFNSRSDADVYLSQADVDVILSHLVWFGYMVLFVILVVLLYAMSYKHESQFRSYN